MTHVDPHIPQAPSAVLPATLPLGPGAAQMQAAQQLAPPVRLRDKLLMPALIALLLLGLFGLLGATGWQEVLGQIARLSPGQITALLALSLLNYLCRGLRWHFFARRLGLATTLAQNLRHYLGGFAMSVTPGRVGELVRMRWIGRETGCSFERCAPLALMDRAADLAAMALLLALAVALVPGGGVAGALPVALGALALAIAVTRPSLLTRLVTMLWRSLGRSPRMFARARSAARALSRFTHAPTLALALTLGAAGWCAEAYAFHLLLGYFGADIGIWKAVLIFVFATLAGGLTGAPGGLGGAEAAMVGLLALDGVAMPIAIAATAVIRLTTLWFAILIGLAALPLAEQKSRQAQAVRVAALSSPSSR